MFIVRRRHENAPPLSDQTLRSLGRKLQEDCGWEAVRRPDSADHRTWFSRDDIYSWYLQGNKIIHREGDRTYKVVWSLYTDGFQGEEGAGNGDGFVEALQPRDRVVIRGRVKVTLSQQMRLRV